MQDFAQMITSKVKSRKPSCSVEHQYSTMLHPWYQGVNRNIALASDYCGGDFYGGMPQHSMACKLYYNMTRNQPFEYMTSRSYPDLLEHTTTKTEDMLRQSVMATLAHHGAALLIDAIDPRGTLDSRLYDSYGKIFGEAEKYEKYMIGSMMQDVAVFVNLEAKYNPAHSFATDMPQLNAATGASKFLQRSHIPYGVFSDWRPEKMNGSKLIVASDAYHLADDVIDYLIAYVRNGGKMYCSGRLPPRLSEALLGFVPKESFQEAMTYMAPAAGTDSLFQVPTREYPLAVKGLMQNLSGIEADQVLATLALPYQAPETPERHPDKLDGFDYKSREARFASIHSNPPGRWLDIPTLILKKAGKGTVIYSATPFEASDRPANETLFIQLIRLLLDKQPAWSFEADAPAQLELVGFDVPRKRLKLVSLINSLEAFSIPALSDITVRVRVPSEAKTVKLLPAETPVAFTQQGEYVSFQVERVHICEMFAVEY